MASDHNQLFQHTYAQPEHAIGLLREVLPAPLAAAIDWRSLQLVPGSSVDDSLRSRHADVLFSARAAGVPLLLYVLLEHKSVADPLTPLQLLRYIVRTWNRHLEQHPHTEAVPPIVPIVVYHGDRPWRAPRTLRGLVDLGALPAPLRAILRPLQPDLRFLLDDLAAVTEAELRARRGTVMHRLTGLLLQFVRPATERDPVDFVHRWRALWRALWRDPRSRSNLFALFSYLSAQLEAPVDRLAAAAALIHEDARDMGKTIADQLREEGMRRGEAKGHAEGRADLLLRLLRGRFGNAADAHAVSLRSASAEQLDRWADRLLAAATLDDVFA